VIARKKIKNQERF
jgi:calcium-dependent protein kinase